MAFNKASITWSEEEQVEKIGTLMLSYPITVGSGRVDTSRPDNAYLFVEVRSLEFESRGRTISLDRGRLSGNHRACRCHAPKHRASQASRRSRVKQSCR